MDDESVGPPPKPAHKKLASLHLEAEEEKKTRKTASGRNVTTASFGRSRVSFSSGASFFRRHLSLGSGGKSASFSSEKLGAPSFGERRPKDGAEAVFVKRDVSTLMALWRDGVNRLMQVLLYGGTFATTWPEMCLLFVLTNVFGCLVVIFRTLRCLGNLLSACICLLSFEPVHSLLGSFVLWWR